MPLYEPLVPARYAEPLLTCLAKSNSALVQAALNDIGLIPADLTCYDSAMTIEAFDRLFHILHEQTGRTDLGFEFGLGITLATHGPLGDAMAHCETIGEMLALASRFTRLMSPSIALKYRRETEFHELLWQPAAGMSSFTLHAFFELHVTSTYQLLKGLLGDRLTPYEVWMPIPRPPHIARYAELEKLTVHFGVPLLPEVRTCLPIELAYSQIINTDQRSSPTLDDLNRLQNPLLRGGKWRDWVTLILRESEACQPTQAELAELMSMSSHTLARRLSQEGSRFRDIANNVRHQKACKLLADPRQSIEQISYRLGYRQLSNFSHAFKRRQSESPQQYRHRLFSH